jgi:hypothetical protein
MVLLAFDFRTSTPRFPHRTVFAASFLMRFPGAWMLVWTTLGQTAESVIVIRPLWSLFSFVKQQLPIGAH